MGQYETSGSLPTVLKICKSVELVSPTYYTQFLVSTWVWMKGKASFQRKYLLFPKYPYIFFRKLNCWVTVLSTLHTLSLVKRRNVTFIQLHQLSTYKFTLLNESLFFNKQKLKNFLFSYFSITLRHSGSRRFPGSGGRGKRNGRRVRDQSRLKKKMGRLQN